MHNHHELLKLKTSSIVFHDVPASNEPSFSVNVMSRMSSSAKLLCSTAKSDRAAEYPDISICCVESSAGRGGAWHTAHHHTPHSTA